MDEERGLRRSARARKTVIPAVAITETSVHNHKRKRQEAFPELVTSLNNASIVDTAVKVKSVIKTEPVDLDNDTALHQLDKDYAPVAPQRKRVKKSKTVKVEISDDHDDSMMEKPKRKTTKKRKKKEPDVPRRLVITDGIVRPPGEKRPPMVYPVVRKPRDPKLPSLLSEMVANFSARIERARAKYPRLKPGEKETRLLPYNEEPTGDYLKIVDRAITQRLFVLQRERSTEPDCHAHHDDCPVETCAVVGSSGNVYDVTISHKCSCNCADYMFRKRNCKHILYVLHNVLKVTGHLQYQDAFLTSELQEIARNAPALPETVAKEDKKDGHRKPIEDDCPICCMAFEKGEDIVWCQALCGNNVHHQCFKRWAEARPHNVTCPFCRSAWQKEAPKTQAATFANVTMPMMLNTNGYLNVADQLGYT